MSSAGYPYQITRPPVVIPEPRLRHLLLRDPLRCATVSEYADSAGMDTAEVVTALDELLEQGVLGLETVSNEMFIHTAPHGRPAPEGKPEVPANLWELFRNGIAQEGAAGLWRLSRGLTAAGWVIEVHPAIINFGMSHLNPPPKIGVTVGHLVVPVVPYPEPAQLAASAGVLASYDWAGARAVAITCASGRLDSAVTATRQFFIEQGGNTGLAVLILEAPRFAPTLLSGDDQALEPRTVTRAVLTASLAAQPNA